MNFQVTANGFLKIIFFVHFTLVTWGIQGLWSTTAFLFYNTFFLAFIVWALIRKDDSEPIFMAFVTNALSFLFDVIILGVHFTNSTPEARFSAATIILNLFMRLVSTVLLYRNYKDRQGMDLSNLYPGFSTPGAGARYEDIDHQQQVPPSDVSPVPPAYGDVEKSPR